MGVPDKVYRLVKQFDANRYAYKSHQFDEAQVRVDFINPLLKDGLGWDVDNEKGLLETYREVVYEDRIKVGGGTKAPDYGFYLGGHRKFFLEAKKPSVDIAGDVAPAVQLRRYAWSANLPLSLLTDFEELAVYDCRFEPNKTDKSTTARLSFITYDQYADRWDDIYSLFSREAVLEGALDKFAESTKRKRGTETVDDAFLKEIESWREQLARNLALSNKLTPRQLNYAVQMTIDRIIFLRMAEDRGIENYGRLLTVTDGARVYDRLCELFQEADDRYNSGLFHFRRERERLEEPDSFTLHLDIDDELLRNIIGGLYYPESPYEFGVLPVDVLGQVYEQFLGKVIRLEDSNKAVVEEKPEVRKAGGVYYTPIYIVDYIVEQTVGKLFEGKKPGPRGGVSKLRIVDPACGSGSFLVGAYQYLLDWHRDRYIEDGPEKHPKELYQGLGDRWMLTIDEKKRILLNNIYGVDVDAQAVEVTKLSLLLKVLEGESEQTLQTQLRMFQERALPDLDNNIKWGNSLISPDFYKEEQMALLDEEEHYRINVFDWELAFPEIFSGDNPGFDAVIGNPPYIRMESFKNLKSYLKSKFASHEERADLYSYFVEQGHKLLRTGGHFGMIVSNKFLRAKYGKPLRDFLNRYAMIERIVDFAGLPVFPDATVRTLVLLTRRETQGKASTLYSPPLTAESFLSVKSGALSVDKAVEESTYKVSPDALAGSVWSFTKIETEATLRKLKQPCLPLAEYCKGQIYMGVKSGLTQAFVIDGKTRIQILEKNPEAGEIIKPFLNGRDVRRYGIEWKDTYLIYTYHGVEIDKYPAVEKYLTPFRDRLEKRATRQEWYELQQPQLRYSQYMDSTKIIFPDIAKAPRFTLDKTGYYGANTTYFIPHEDLYLLGLLNSRVGNFYFVQTCAGLEGNAEVYLRFFGQYLEGFPVRPINPSSRNDIEHREQVAGLVESMLELHKQLADAKISQEKTIIQRQIDGTDRQIDGLVYELYGLTEDEIKIVEESHG